MAEGDAWTTIESDPGVLTELIEKMGCKNVQVEELYSLDEDSLRSLEPVYGLIFLFKWQKEQDDRPVESDYEERGVFFARQVITNACATQAIVSVLLNNPGLDLGQDLVQLREFTQGMDAEMKGLAIGNSETIRSVHNSFSPPQSIIPEEKPERGDDDEAFHFIAYVPVAGALYELDGLKPGPIRLADCTEAAKFVTERIGRYSENEIKFNLLAVVRDRLASLTEELDAQRALQQRIQTRLAGGAPSAVEAGAPLPDDPAELAARLAGVEGECDRLALQLEAERSKHARWHEENVRRRTDYIPAIFQLLRALADEKQLQPLLDRAIDAKRQKK